MTALTDLIPDPAARAFLRIIAAEHGHETAAGFLAAMVEGRWVYAGKVVEPSKEVESPSQSQCSSTSKRVETQERLC